MSWIYSNLFLQQSRENGQVCGSLQTTIHCNSSVLQEILQGCRQFYSQIMYIEKLSILIFRINLRQVNQSNIRYNRASTPLLIIPVKSLSKCACAVQQNKNDLSVQFQRRVGVVVRGGGGGSEVCSNV